MVPIHDLLADHLITPPNVALMVVDYQQNQFRSVRSMDSLCPVCSRPIKNNATAIQLSRLRLKP